MLVLLVQQSGVLVRKSARAGSGLHLHRQEAQACSTRVVYEGRLLPRVRE